jgi:hypothetical protein
MSLKGQAALRQLGYAENKLAPISSTASFPLIP